MADIVELLERAVAASKERVTGDVDVCALCWW